MIVLFCPGVSPKFELSFEYSPALVAPKVPVTPYKGGLAPLHKGTYLLARDLSHKLLSIIKSTATHTSQIDMKIYIQKNFKTIDVIHHAIGNEKLINAIS